MSPDVDALVDEDRYELGVITLVRVIVRRWWVIAIIVALSTGMAVRNIRTTVPVYEAGTDVRINEAQGEWVFGITGVRAQDPVRAMETQQLVIQSWEVWQEVERRMGTDQIAKVVGIDAELQGKADVIRVNIRSHDADFAVAASREFADAYIEVRKQQVAATLRDLKNHLEAQATRYRAESTALNTRIAELSDLESDSSFLAALATETANNVALTARLADTNATGDNPELARLLAEREVILKLLVEMNQRAEQVDIDSAIAAAGAQIVSEAQSADGPLGPTAQRSLLVAVIAGVALGIAAAFAVDYLDDRLRDGAVVERELRRRVRLLGSTPRIRRRPLRRRGVAATLVKPTSPLAEAFRVIRAMLIAEAQRTPVQTLLVTSSQRREGKTTVAANLATTLARSGVDVVLIDANLRRPRVHGSFGLPQQPGLTSVIAGDVALSQTMFHIQGNSIVGSLRVLTAGPTAGSASTAVVDGHRFIDILRSVQADADVVLIDSPAVLTGSDTRVLAGLVDGAIVVARRKMTRRRKLARTVEALGKAGVPSIWGVLNGFGQRSWSIDLRRSRSDDVRIETREAPQPDRAHVDI